MLRDEYTEAPDLQTIAEQLIFNIERVGHVELNTVIFLREINTSPTALAKCFNLQDHPIGFFSTKEYAIVVYNQNVNYMTQNQLKILVLHELQHIPPLPGNMIDHNVKDFRNILEYGLDWCDPETEVPDILAI